VFPHGSGIVEATTASGRTRKEVATGAEEKLERVRYGGAHLRCRSSRPPQSSPASADLAPTAELAGPNWGHVCRRMLGQGCRAASSRAAVGGVNKQRAECGMGPRGAAEPR
jgi:hypothetical protein